MGFVRRTPSARSLGVREFKSAGVAAVFGPGATTGEIVDFLRGAVVA